jgi:hypothetical protein
MGICLLYKFRKQIPYFLCARGQTDLKIALLMPTRFFFNIYISKTGLWISLDRLLDSCAVIIVCSTMLLLIRIALDRFLDSCAVFIVAVDTPL